MSRPSINDRTLATPFFLISVKLAPSAVATMVKSRSMELPRKAIPEKAAISAMPFFLNQHGQHQPR